MYYLITLNPNSTFLLSPPRSESAPEAAAPRVMPSARRRPPPPQATETRASAVREIRSTLPPPKSKGELQLRAAEDRAPGHRTRLTTDSTGHLVVQKLHTTAECRFGRFVDRASS